MGQYRPRRASRSGLHRCTWVLWLLLLHGTLWRASSAAQCTGSCAVDVDAVCGADGKSYVNSCVASCGGVEVSHAGYCKGDRIRFVQPESSSSNSNARQPQPNWRLARESEAVIARHTLNRFASEGYVYRGKVALSALPTYVKESTAATQVTTSLTAADAADAASATTAADASSNTDTSNKQTESAAVQVSVVRVDSSGNMYHKTYKYDPKRFSQTAYPPYNPAPLTASQPAAQQSSASGTLSNMQPSASAKPAQSGAATGSSNSNVTAPATNASSNVVSRPNVPQAQSAAAPAKQATPAASPPPSPAAAPMPGKSAPAPAPAQSKTSTPAAASPAATAKAPVAPAPAAPTKTVTLPGKGSLFSQYTDGGGDPSSASSDASTSTSSSSSSGAGKGSVTIDPDYFSMVERPSAGSPSPVSTALPAAADSAAPSAPVASGGDLFSMVSWGPGSSSSGGNGASITVEILKPEMGSYASNTNDSSSSAGAVDMIDATTGLLLSPSASDVAALPSGSVSGIYASTEQQTAVPAHVAMHTGTPGQPDVGVTTVLFPAVSPEEYEDQFGPQDDAEEKEMQLQVQELLKQQQAAQLLKQQTGVDHGDILEPETATVPSSEAVPPISSLEAPPVESVPAAPTPSCTISELTCTDRVTGMSRYFGNKTAASKYMDQVPMVGKGRVRAVTMYYNRSSGCLRGMQVTYNHVSHPTSFYTSVLLGSAVTTNANIVVKTLKLGQKEVVDRAEVYSPKCVQYVKLFTSKNNSMLVGKVDPGGVVYTPAKNRPSGMLVAIRGFQDKAVYKGASKDKPPGVYPGVLKQLQFVWGQTVCNCSIITEAGKARQSNTTVITANGNVMKSAAGSGKSGRRLAGVGSASAESHRLLEVRTRRLQDLWRRRRLAAAALAASGETDATRESNEVVDNSGLTIDDEHTSTSSTYINQRLGSSNLRQASVIGMSMDNTLPAYDAASIHRMLSVIHPDTRQPCPLLTYPYKVLGQINAKARDGGFVCSGGLIGEDRVLTAGHCVWDDRDTQSPFEDLSFSPAQWKKDGKVTAPLGQVDWDYVTLFEAYVNDPDGEGLAYDVAVITLKRQVGKTLGYLGIKTDVAPCKSAPLALTLAGYPGDDPAYPIAGGWQGGCFYDTCTVNFSCGVSITNHTCDSYVGQSGAPMYDRENYVRAVHTLGVLPGFSLTNGAITIQKFILDNVMGYWKDSSGFAPAPPGSFGPDSYF